MRNADHGTRTVTIDAGPKTSGGHGTRTELIAHGRMKIGEPGSRAGRIALRPNENGSRGMRTAAINTRAKHGGHGGISTGGVAWARRIGRSWAILGALRDRKKKNGDAPRVAAKLHRRCASRTGFSRNDTLRSLEIFGLPTNLYFIWLVNLLSSLSCFDFGFDGVCIFC